MQSVTAGRFVFACCQVGAERALKQELARAHPELRFAFSRPGFVTFKLDPARPPLPPDFVLRAVFARCWGLSLGALAANNDSDDARASALLQELRRDAPPGTRRLALHVWERDRWPAGEVPPSASAGAWAAQALEAIGRQAGPELELNLAAQPGQLVHDLVVVDEGVWWRGQHRHTPPHSPHPGGRPPLELPPDAPSRAYLKLEDGLLWCGATPRPGEVAVEIGSAPGGASLALLRRGLRVVGVDPGAMAAIVLDDPRFTHLACGVERVQRVDLPPTVHWLVLDMNVQPRHALRILRQLLPGLRDGLLGILLTLKLNQWALAEQIPAVLRQLRGLGLAQVDARQLASNHQELFVCGLTTAGLAHAAPATPGAAP